jgi:hypothetical protein
MQRIPACDQVTELDGLAELTTLRKSLRVIARLIFYKDDSKVGITDAGGVEAVLEVIKTFPKCHDLQTSACGVLARLISHNIIRQNRAVKLGCIDVLLVATCNHLRSAEVCAHVCCALVDIATGSKENTERLITLGGAAAVDKLKIMWPDNKRVQLLTTILSSPAGTSNSASSKVNTASPDVPAMSSEPRDDINRKPTGTPEAVVASDDLMSSEVATASPKVPTIPSQPGDDRKRKPTRTPDAVVANDDSPCSELATASPKVPTIPSQPGDKRKRNPTDTSDTVVGVNDHRSSEAATASTEISTMPSQPADSTIYSQPRDDRKRNEMETPEAVVTGDGHSPRVRKSRRVCTDLFATTITSPQKNAPAATEGASTAHMESSPTTQHEETASYTEPPEEPTRSMWTLLGDLHHSDTAKVDAALEALRSDLVEDSTIWDHLFTVGSCVAAVQLTALVSKEAMRWMCEE